MTLLYVVMWWLFRHGLPWISRVLIPPTRTTIELSGVALLLPAYLVSTLFRRVGGRVPGVMFLYDDIVRNLTKGCHWTAAMLLDLAAGLRNTSKFVLAVLLVALVGLWDVTYCTGAGSGCMIPTSQWMGSVSRAVKAHQPTPTPTPKPCPRKHRSARTAKCASKHRSRG